MKINIYIYRVFTASSFTFRCSAKWCNKSLTNCYTSKYVFLGDAKMFPDILVYAQFSKYNIFCKIKTFRTRSRNEFSYNSVQVSNHCLAISFKLRITVSQFRSSFISSFRISVQYNSVRVTNIGILYC